MPEQEYIFEYELIDISFEQGYELPKDDVAWCVSEDAPSQNDEHKAIEYDADGIPMGNSQEEKHIRRNIIHEFIQQWRTNHKDTSFIFNENLNENIKINQLFLIESVSHAIGNYKSTKAVLRFEEVMSKARKIGLTRIKEGNSNQKPFQQMIVMRYSSEDLGNVKMTVGIRKVTKEKVQYSITVPNEGTPFIDETMKISGKNKSKKRKKHPK